MRQLIVGLAVAGSLVVLGPAGAAAAVPNAVAVADCRDEQVTLTVEETRLTRTLGTNPEPVAAQILRRSGFDRPAARFARVLCGLPSARAARAYVAVEGRLLWERAVRRAQHGTAAAGALPGGDDRPLYWARLEMTAALRQWTPRFPLSDGDRAELEKLLEYSSRGITSGAFNSTTTLFVSGFDPFQLDQEVRRGNPSGAAVLALDGRRLRIDGRLVEVQAVVFPVRYADFDRGMVEDAYRPHLVGGGQQADMITTISQGRPEAFDLEVWNGRRRSVSSIGDNNNIQGGGTLTAPVVFPGVRPGAEFIRTSLPVEAMVGPTGQPYLVRINPAVVEIPAGSTTPVTRPDGPTPGSVAVQGSGGGYLSNESAYRTSLLRVTLGAAVPGGHVHTPVLLMAPGNTTEITDPTFERNRSAISAQVELILRAGAGTL